MHRDLKAANILLDGKFRRTLCDFCLSRDGISSLANASHGRRYRLLDVGEDVRRCLLRHQGGCLVVGLAFLEMVPGDAPFHGDSSFCTQNVGRRYRCTRRNRSPI
jgi:serine/threonine protein kinase